MLIRTVLVSFVAAMGLTLPSGEQVTAWGRQTRCWVNDGTTGRIPENAGVDGSVGFEEWEDRVVSSALSGPVISPEKGVAEVSVVALPFDVFAVIAPVEPVAVATSEAVVVEAAPVAIADDAAFHAAMDETVAAFVADLASPKPEATMVAVQDAAFHAAMDETVAVFVADLATPRADAPALAVGPTDVAEEIPIEVAVRDRGTAGMCSIGDPYERPFSRPMAEMVAEVGDEFDAVVIFGTESGPEVVPPASVATAEATPALDTLTEPSGDRLARAVTLTREAVFAWASLLHGPAVVTIAH